MATFEPVDAIDALDFFLGTEGISTERHPVIPRAAGDASMQPSFAQQRLWFLQQLDPTSPAYNIAFAVRVRGPLDCGLLQASFNLIVQRHTVLRTHFRSEAGKPVPIVSETLDVGIELLEFATMATDAMQERLRNHLQVQAAMPFDLAKGPLLRVSVARLGASEHVISLVMHHIISDGWSIGVLVRELSALYSALHDGLPTPLPELAIQYEDFALWQRGQRDHWAVSLDYWREQLAGVSPNVISPDHPDGEQVGFACAVHPIEIGPKLLEKVKALAAEERSTLFMAFLAAFQTLLARYADRTDIVVGAPVAGRFCDELEPLIGCFVNTIVLRSRWPTNASFRDVLRRVRTTALAAYENDGVPFDEVVRNLAPERESHRNTLFQVMFNVETEMAGSLSFKQAAAVGEPIPSGTAKFDLMLSLAPSGDGFAGGIEYRADLFDSATIARMAGHFVRLLETAFETPDIPAARLPLLLESERQRLLYDFNPTASTIPEISLGVFFERQALAAPDAVAIEFQGDTLTYGELRQAARLRAAALRHSGIEVGDRVAICLPPGIDMIVSVVAVVSIGAAYVPLVEAFPEQRLAFMIEDTRAKAIITQTSLASRFATLSDNVLCIDQQTSTTDTDEKPVDVSPDQVAYINYTSGSTGTPKGIAITHRAVIRLVCNTNYIDLRSDDRMALASNFAFDAFTFEIWGALLNGARLVGAPRETMLDPERLAGLLRDRGITTLFLTTALFNQIVRHTPRAFEHLRHLLVGGEAVDASVMRDLLAVAPPARLLNGYGPTECTTFATWQEVREVGEQARNVPIGRPLSNTSAYVLDHALELAPQGVAGMLFLSGPGLAQGYINQPGLTAASFLPDPFSVTPGERMYRTGDIVRWNPDGQLDYLGRADEQIKIRGFRIEPAEIAAALKTHPDVTDCVVMAPRDGSGHRRLIAYVVTGDGVVSPDGFRAYLASHLPDYMIPGVFVGLTQLPLNANGKVDRTALPQPGEEGTGAQHDDESPRNARESAVANAFREALRRESIGLRRNYFELGGDSITAIQIVGRLKQDGLVITVRDIFEHPTVEGLAARARSASPVTDAFAPLLASAPLSPVQQWFFECHHGAIHHFNQSVFVRSRTRIDPVLLSAALNALADRHDALRTVFPGASLDRQQVISAIRPSLSVVDLIGQEPSFLQEQVALAQRNCDLGCGPLFRAVLFKGTDEDRLLLVAHHLIVDGVSWRILLDELQRAYRQLSEGTPVSLGPQPLAWQRWVLALHDLVRSDMLIDELQHWRAIAKTAQSSAFPQDGESVDNLFGEAEALSLTLSEAETRALLEGGVEAFDAPANDLLLTALARALSTWGGIGSCVITLEGHGRDALGDAVDAGGTIGWFTSLYPFQLELVGAQFEEQLAHIRSALRRTPRGGASYGLLRYLGRAEGLAYAAPLSFNYLGRFDAGSAEGGWALADETMGDQFAPDLRRQHDLDVTAIVLAGQLHVSIMFHAGRHRRDRVSALLEAFKNDLSTLAALLREQTVAASGGGVDGGLVPQPSSFTLSDIGEGDLDRIFRHFSSETSKSK